MATTFQCPACGGIIEYSSNNQEMTCPFCGTAITTPGASSAATVVMSKPVIEPVNAEADSSAGAKTVIQQSPVVMNSAEIIDEVKRSLREDDKNGAVRIFSKGFNVSLTDAQTSVDQIEIDMKHSGKEAAPAPEPDPVSTPVAAQQIPAADIFDAAAAQPPKSNTTRNWIIGCSVAAVLFCCLCVILPTIIISLAGSQFPTN